MEDRLQASAPITFIENVANLQWVRRWWITLSAWAFIWLAMTAAFFAEASGRQGAASSFFPMAKAFLPYFFPWAAFSLAIFPILQKHMSLYTTAFGVLQTVLGGTVFFFIPYVGYEVLLGIADQGITWIRFRSGFLEFPIRNLLMDYLLFLGCMATHFVIASHQSKIELERAQLKADAENQSLRYELEHQKLLLLQAQLEPHFLFNALNAISSLIRQNRLPHSLTALTTLSELLRSALSASQQEWSTLGEEITFVSQYLDMQKLRFEDRLEVSWSGVESSIKNVPCPPLILQPLVENAIRHATELHDEVTVLRLQFQAAPMKVSITLSNPIVEGSANPGLGLGIRTVSERLQGLYGDQAHLRQVKDEGWYHITLTLPSLIND